MMSSLNKMMFIGRLGGDVETRYTQTGTALANFRIAVNEKWRDKSGDQQERVEWIPISVFGNQAESCAEHLTKGRLVHVEGKWRSREYQDKTGATKYVVECIADRVTFLGGGSRDEGDRGSDRSSQTNKRREDPGAYRKDNGGASGRGNDDLPPPLDDGDIPF